MDRRRLLLNNFEKMPSEYKRLKYVKATGSQWVSLGLDYLPTDFEIELKLSPHSISNGIQTYLAFYYSNWAKRSRLLYNHDGVTEYFRCYNAVDTAPWYNIGLSTGNFWDKWIYVKYICTNGTLTVYSKNFSGGREREISHAYTVGELTDGDVRLFTNAESGSEEQKSSASVEYIKIKYNGKLIRNCIPALRKEDGKVGLYDFVSKNFFTSQTTQNLLYE